jgi:hypothetical protein
VGKNPTIQKEQAQRISAQKISLRDLIIKTNP